MSLLVSIAHMHCLLLRGEMQVDQHVEGIRHVFVELGHTIALTILSLPERVTRGKRGRHMGQARGRDGREVWG